ncbi:LacI family transcriptional regulator [Planococcus sp. CPCC 101016]|uniref:LacI family DNA-binding transcriptional regulator n=1 Tax=Planococcus sp. CPCC 101016 TaxID=2599617 RepID=UPI0011B3E364|nr:substrate-binding domain-containing protein [Planococcus sp. CPCC 101016]TWT05288.1 LacI family transcriptional regulator [Planococcus sp. CPCC 101016]
MKTITMATVAQHAQVSKSTVSHFLNGRYSHMSDETKKRVEKSIKELDYRPNILARSLKQKTTTTIGVIVANSLHTFSAQVIRSIEDICNKADFHLIVCNADNDSIKEQKYIDMLRAKQVDGMIILPTGHNEAIYNDMVDSNYPVVFVDRTLPNVAIPSVMVNNEMASRLAVQHFIDSGYRKISIITNEIDAIAPRIERIVGYKKTLDSNGLKIEEDYIKALEIQHVQQGVKELLELEEPPQAILAGNDLTLIEILKYLKSQNLKIPKDMAVIGIDDVSFASFFEPALTIVEQPAFDIGKKAAELLMGKIQKEGQVGQSKMYLFEPELVIRNSC